MKLIREEQKKWISHFQKEAKEAYETAKDLFESKRYHYDALFFCHLALEKAIKAYFLKKEGKFAPPVHDLIFILKKAKALPDKEILEKLAEANMFNIRARYDDYKREFYKKATKEYAQRWLKETKKILEIYLSKIQNA